MSISIRSGGATVIASGQVTGFLGAPIELELSLRDGHRFVVAFRFLSDTALADVGVRSTLGAQRLDIELTNFDKADGRGSARPVPVVQDGDEWVLLHFRVFRFGHTDDRTVHYTLYRAASGVAG